MKSYPSSASVALDVVVGRNCDVSDLFRRSGDNVPAVNETRKEAKAAKRDVDQRVCRAKPTLNPDRKRRKDDGDDDEESIGVAHLGCCSAATSRW